MLHISDTPANDRCGENRMRAAVTQAISCISLLRMQHAAAAPIISAAQMGSCHHTQVTRPHKPDKCHPAGSGFRTQLNQLRLLCERAGSEDSRLQLVAAFT